VAIEGQAGIDSLCEETAMSGKRVLVINYGMGNISSVCNALEQLSVAYQVSVDHHKIADADAYILPGVGAFAAAMENLRRLDLVDRLTRYVVEEGRPYLGICLGMQLLADDSTEGGLNAGLGWVSGHVREMPPAAGLRLPHVGWNTPEYNRECPLFTSLDDKAHFFFDHNYHLLCDEKLVVAWCEYGARFVAAVRKGNIFASQFHPEKSQRNGLKMLRNFSNYINAL
jgi:imidazole glycerol-phosphate synthase subunit HisH